MLRKPFALNSCMSVHKCQWELFDVNKAGCKLCGKLHVCEDGKCLDVEKTHDGVVCCVTGVYLRTVNFQENEYEDRVISCVPKKHLYSGDRENDWTCEVENYVLDLLHSPRSIAAFKLSKQRMLMKILNHIHKTTNTNVVTGIETAINSHAREVFDMSYNKNERVLLAKRAMKYVLHLIHSCKTKLKIKLKNSEIKIFCFGLLYMMRHGIHTHGIVVLPRLPQLSKILPCESVLQKIFKFKAKHITDVENKFKLILRQMDASSTQMLGFHEKSFDI